MIRVAILRGDYLNNFEMQNYELLDKSIQVTGFTSLNPIHTKFSFPLVFLPSIPPSKGSSFIMNRLIGDRQILYGLEKYLTKFDIVHTADPHYYYSYQAAQLRAEKKIKMLVTTYWETIPHNNESVKKKKDNKYFVMQHTDRFLCYTRRAKKCLITEGIDPKKITVIPLGVNLEKFNNRSIKSDQKKVEILFVGRLVDEKGVLDLYTAFKLLQPKSRESNYYLRIIGSGPLKEKLKKKIRQDNLSSSISIEEKSYEEMPEVYNKADIFVLPSKTTKTWEEQYGMVLIEALASGLPIIAYNSGSVSEIIEDKGFIIPEGDTEQLIQKILSLNYETRKKYATQATKFAFDQYNAQKSAKKLEAFYHALIT